MSMTAESEAYFKQNAGEWDEIRAGYFTEAVRDAAIRKAYLRSDMTVADVGAGTGYMTAGLAPLVAQVWALDGSAEMLAVAQRNLTAFNNVKYQTAEGHSLPLEDSSVDAVFANMYLHHLPDPLAALREMVRILRPGGRLVITDMESHPYEWFKEEMADVWLGFERQQVQSWFEQAGLVNIIVDYSGEMCSAETLHPEQRSEDERKVHIRVFVAVGTKRVAGVKAAVQAGYGATAAGNGSCCTPDESGGSCCGGDDTLISIDDNLGVQFVPDYSMEERQSAPEEAANIALGCGNPTAMANLRIGETVLDIGSGGGLDAFLAAGKVGPSGRVIGVDMTPEMLARARATAEKSGIANVEFRQGEAESLPVDDASVDVILSNCVINLTEDKGRVFGEAFRVLNPGGRLEVSDMVTDRGFNLAQVMDPAGWPGCVYGALPETEYSDLVRQAGFKDVQVRRSASTGSSGGVQVYSIHLTAYKP